MSTSYWSCNNKSLSNLPFKVQALIIKNTGKSTIYLFGIVEDLLLSTNILTNFSPISINPGDTVDLTNNPFIPTTVSHPDFDVTIHSYDEISVDIISSDPCDRWISDSNRPWNGGTLPNGQFTKKFSNYGTIPTNQFASNILTGATARVLVNGKLIASCSNISWSNNSIGYNDEELVVNNGPKQSECICTSSSLFNNGCICGHIKSKNWGL